MQYQVLIVSALAGLSAALTQPDTTKFPQPEGNAITSPLNQIVPAGKAFTITWTPSTPGKVSLLLLKGPSSNAVPIATLADSIDNSGTFVWTPDTSLAPTTDAQGYGIELVVEGTGQYQYSTQIGIGKADGASDSSSASVSLSSSSYASVETAPYGSTPGTAVGGALDETVTVPCSTSTSTSTAAAPAVTAATGTNNVTSPLLTPTAPMSVPSSLATVAQPTATAGANSVSSPGSNTGSGSVSNSTASSPNGISTAAAPVNGVQLTGTLAAIAGLLSYFAL